MQTRHLGDGRGWTVMHRLWDRSSGHWRTPFVRTTKRVRESVQSGEDPRAADAHSAFASTIDVEGPTCLRPPRPTP